jgi:hypothetical protein
MVDGAHLRMRYSAGEGGYNGGQNIQLGDNQFRHGATLPEREVTMEESGILRCRAG